MIRRLRQFFINQVYTYRLNETRERFLLAGFIGALLVAAYVTASLSPLHQAVIERPRAEIFSDWVVVDPGVNPSTGVAVSKNKDIVKAGKETTTWKDSRYFILTRDFHVSHLSRPGLYIDGIAERFEIYQDGQKIYSFGMDLPAGEIPGVGPHFVPLLEDRADTKLSIKISSHSDVVGFYGYQAFGEIDSLRVLSFKMHLSQFAVSVIALFAFFAFAGVAALSKDQRVPFTLYSVLCVVSAAYFYGQSRVGGLYDQNPQFALIVNRHSLMLLNFGLLVFFEYVVRDYPSLWGRRGVFMIAAACLLSVILVSLDPSATNRIFRPWQIMTIAAQVYVFIASVVLMRRSGGVKDKALALAMMFVVVTAIHDVFLSTGMLGFDVTSWRSHWGGLFMLIAFGWILGVRAKETQDAMDEFTANLQDKVAERTIELEASLKNLQKQMDARAHAESVARNTSRMAAVAELSSGLAHEINNPLTIINGYLHVIDASLAKIEQQDVKEQMFKAVKSVFTNTERIRKIVKGLRDFAEGDAVGLMEPLELGHLTETLSILVSSMLRKNDASLNIIFTDEGARLGRVSCNQAQINQVIINLISNAIDAYPEGDEKVIEMILSQDDLVTRIEVIDHGMGIPADVRGKIFEPFMTTKNTDRGTGLGLSSSLGIVKSHGGTLTFETSTVPDPATRGTKFIITLPTADRERVVA